MRTTSDSVSVATNSQVRVAGLVAARISDNLTWGEGTIRPLDAHASAEDQGMLLAAVLESIEPVTEEEMPYSACTDGRIPVRLMSGEVIPVREQVVGADLVSAFYVAEVLGASFYKDPAADVRVRLAEVADFLKENGLMPSSHVACGAAGGFVGVMQNIVRFSADKRFMARLRDLLPADVYDEQLYEAVVQASAQQLNMDAYAGLDAQVFLGAALNASSEHAVAELKDDGRGIHGHVEELIIRVRIPGYGINEAKVAELTKGREVFGVNDNRIEKLARLFGRGNDSDYKKAHMALETFADAAHGTLAKDLPTWIVTKD